MQCCICHAALAAVHLGSLWFFSVHSDPSRSKDMAILVRSPDVSAEMCYVPSACKLVRLWKYVFK